MNSERNVTFKMGNEFLCKRSVPRADGEIPVKKNSKRKHSDKKDSDMIEKNLKQIKKIKKRRSELKEFKDILLKIAQPPSITVFANNFSLGSDFFDLQKSFIDDTNNSFCIVKEQQKKLDIKIVEPLLEKHAKFRPPISEERSKRIAEKNNSSLSISASSSTSGSPSTKGISLKIERTQSLSSSSSLTSDYKTFDISEELFNIRTEACAIPGLDLINESDSLKVNEIYEKMDKINPCLGKIDINFCQKESSCLKAMIKSDAIHAKYKCMGAMCSYHSSNKEMFLAHLNAHAQEQYLANDYFLNCSYCLWKFKKPQNLVDHLKDVHHFCRFQCSECFYRSVCQMSVYDHQEQFHPNQKARIIECLDVPLLKESNIDKARLEVRCNVKAEKLDCCVCFDKFNSYDECMKHFETHINGDETQQKMIEVQKSQMSRDKKQLKLGRYICLFCSSNNQFASDRERVLRTHMQNHPLKFHITLDTNNNKMISMKPRGDLKEKTIEVESLVPNEDLVCKIKY